MFALTIFCLFMTRDAKSPKVPHARTYQGALSNAQA